MLKNLRFMLGGNNKVNVDYKIRLLPDNNYTLVLTFKLPASWYADLLDNLSRTSKKTIEMLDEFKVDKQFYKKVAKDIWGTVRKIENKVSHNRGGIKIVTVDIEDMTVRKKELIETTINIRGVWYDKD